MPFMIRPEQAADAEAIAALVQNAFQHAPHSDGTEQDIIARLRAKNHLTVSLVAEPTDGGGGIIGHIAFSPLTVPAPGQNWFGLAPLAVAPAMRSQGAGADLVRAGLEILRRRGAEGCAVLGEPAYYGRFGFRADTRLRLKNTRLGYFQILPFGAAVPEGFAAYDPAFYA